jgi:acetyl-CoA carboxylase biotin carboxyl carrier protein
LIVKALLLGLCHLSTDPASPTFVTEGGQISAGQTICLIKAMKVKTAVTATHSGKVTKVYVINGSRVFSGDDPI